MIILLYAKSVLLFIGFKFVLLPFLNYKLILCNFSFPEFDIMLCIVMSMFMVYKSKWSFQSVLFWSNTKILKKLQVSIREAVKDFILF